MLASQARTLPYGGRARPSRQGEAAADEVDDEEQALPFLQLQHVGDEEQHQRRRNRRGDAAGGEHRQQAAEARVGEHRRERQARRPHRVPAQPPAARRQRWPARPAPGSGMKTQPRCCIAVATSFASRRWQGGGHHYAAQREHLARGGDAYPLLRRFADLGAPGVVVDGGQAEADEGQRQGQHQPGATPPFAGGASSAARPSAEQRQGEASGGRRLPRRSLHCPSRGSISASAKRVSSSTAPTSASGSPTLSAYSLGTCTYKRQRGEGQRKAERAVGQHLPRRHRAGGHHPAPSRLARSPGSRVRGSSQMAKKARANSTSSMRPVSLP
jgi:hypothetical protein